VLDTRGPGAGALHGKRTVAVASSGCGVPQGAAAYYFNVTAVPHATLGYLTLWASGAAQPLASTLNALDGSITSNAALVPAVNGNIDAFAPDLTDVIVDIGGYFAP
jgi:hypothetical protein